MSENMSREERQALLATNAIWFASDEQTKRDAQQIILQLARELHRLRRGTECIK